MKKLLSLILCFLILVPLATTAFAVETVYIKDELERIEETREKELNQTATDLKTKYGIGVFLAYVKGHADDTTPETVVGEEKDYVLLLLGERGMRIYVGGTAEKVFEASEDRDRLGYVHDEQDEWDAGVARYLEVAEEYFEDAFAESDPADPVETIGAAETPDAVKTSEDSQEDKPEKEPAGSGISPAVLILVISAVIGICALFIITKKKKA